MRKLLCATLLLCLAPLSTALYADQENGLNNGNGKKIGLRLKLGVIGDSLSDEYYAPAGGRRLGYEGYEWGSILIESRKIYLGEYSEAVTEFGQPEGYEYNFALKGQAFAGVGPFRNTFDLIAPELAGIGSSGQTLQQQAAGLAGLFKTNSIDAGVIQAGANDIFIFLITGGLDFAGFIEDVLISIEQVLDTPIPGGPKGHTLADENIILAKVPRVGPPIIADTINAGIEALAAERGVPVFDMFASRSARITVDPELGLVIPVGGLNIILGTAPSDFLVPPGDPASVDDAQCGFRNDTNSPGCPTLEYQSFSTNDDNTHPTTVVQGLIANDILTALNENYGFDIPLLSDEEILAIAFGL